MTFFQRFSSDAGNAFADLYSSMILGDDAGKSATLTLVLRPTNLPLRSKGPVRIDLGMTFIEINGRAYVKSVAPGSVAEKAGVQPQDAVQYATLFQPEWVMMASEDIVEDSENSIASQHVLALEQKGVRISYDELRRLLAEAMDPTQSAFLSPPTTSGVSYTSWSGPPIPSTVNICVPVPVHEGHSRHGGKNGNSPYSGEMPRPVVFVFRRTRQRKSLHHFGMMPSFRLDDECDFASTLVKRLAPTADMEVPPPDTWEELVHDGTDWLLGRGSMLPPKRPGGGAGGSGTGDANNMYALDSSSASMTSNSLAGPINNKDGTTAEEDPSIPLDEFEKMRAQKLAQLRSRMAAEALMNVDRSEDVEAVTIRGMIQKAVGLAFVRASKVVLGVSLHAGSGIVIARLSDGTWSAPSAIGTWGIGLGVQFGLEVAEYIFILQTQEALEHFKRGGSFTVGGNMGVAVAGAGREAYGAASVGGACGTTSTVNDDEYNDDDSREEQNRPQSVAIAPIVAYAKSQGLYIGVSLEGSRIYSRNDLNRRAYKFCSGRDVSANDILSGKVSTPQEAEELYAALHSVEFTHEMSCLPRPPEVLRKDSANAWYYDRTTMVKTGSTKSQDPFPFLSSLSPDEAEECDAFESQFKNFLYGGVSVQRLLPDAEAKTGRTAKERRTLWLMLPEVGSLRLGFVSKLSDGEGTISNKNSTHRARRDEPGRHSSFEHDLNTIGSEDVTLDSALNTKDGSTINSTLANIRTGNVQLSNRHSVALTDVSVLSQEPVVPIRFKGEDKMEHLRVISIQDVAGTSLLFLANNFREAELLVCGLKLLLERETKRLGVRGGLPVSAFGGRHLAGAMSPSAARGYREISTPIGKPSRRGTDSGYISSDAGGDESVISGTQDPTGKELPDSRRTWGDVPGRNYMRGQAATVSVSKTRGYDERGVPHYRHGQQVVRDVARGFRIPLPLPLCRVLLLDSTSPLVQKWEDDRGDQNFNKSRWAFPPATPRELERHSSEHQLIASGSMCGATRTCSFDRPRYGSMVHLSETHAVDADDAKKVVFLVEEHNPRRGFSVRVRITLRAYKETSCDATIVAECRPVGKDMSNQAAVHKAFLLVLDEIKARYGEDGGGLLAGFMHVVDKMDGEENGNDRPASGRALPTGALPRLFHRTGPTAEEKTASEKDASYQRSKSDNNQSKNRASTSGLVSFEDMLKTGRESPDLMPVNRPSTPSLLNPLPPETTMPGKGNKGGAWGGPDGAIGLDEFDEEMKFQNDNNDARLIEIKPLPKIRLSLMPSPREEDEDDMSGSTSTPVESRGKKKNGNHSKLSGSSSKSKKKKSSGFRLSRRLPRNNEI